MKLAALYISIILTAISPILAIPVNLLGIIFSNGKTRKTYGFLLAFSLAILAYIWIPDQNMDLYRHHQQMSLFSGGNVGNLISYIRADLEPLHYLTKFVVAQTGNYNLLQFIVVLVGYFELFWLGCDLAETMKIKKGVFLVTLLYAFSSLRFIDFASGLRFNFAVINISLGIYFMYFRNTKWLQYLFFLIAISMHVTTLLAIVPILLFTKMKMFKKIKPSSIVILAAVTLSLGAILMIMNNVFGSNSSLMSVFNKMYDSYFSVNTFESTSKLHIGWNLAFPVFNMAFCLISSICMYKKFKNQHYSSLVFYFTIWALIMTFTSGIFMRYGFMIVVMALPIISEFLEHLKKEREKFLLLILTLFVLTGTQLARSFNQMYDSGLTNQLEDNLTKDVFHLLEG